MSILETMDNWNRQQRRLSVECESCGAICENKPFAELMGWIADCFGSWTCPECVKGVQP